MQIGPYEIVLELGRGGMGTVYLARLRGAGGFERLVALKRANVNSLGASDVRKRFLQEARLAASVHHANVVGIHQVGEDELGPYLVCDYVEGESLARLIDICRHRSHLPTRIALRVIHDALAGLAAVHDAVDGHGKPMGILHRDVSIDNLLVGCDGVTRLADFGIAKATVEARLTDAGRLHGKVLYMAPEHLLGEERDRSTDNYAMGVTLWIALADGLPFTGRDHDTLVHQVLTQPIPQLSGVGAQVGPLLDAFVARACHRDRAQRFASAQAMMEALEAAAASECPMATHREVAAFVGEMAGDALALRRERVAASTSDTLMPTEPTPAPELIDAWVSDARATQPVQMRRLTKRIGAWSVASVALAVSVLTTYALWPHGAATAPAARPEQPSKAGSAADARSSAQPALPRAIVPPPTVTPSLATPPASEPAHPHEQPDEHAQKRSRSHSRKKPAESPAEQSPAAATKPADAATAPDPGIATQNPYR